MTQIIEKLDEATISYSQLPESLKSCLPKLDENTSVILLLIETTDTTDNETITVRRVAIKVNDEFILPKDDTDDYYDLPCCYEGEVTIRDVLKALENSKDSYEFMDYFCQQCKYWSPIEWKCQKI